MPLLEIENLSVSFRTPRGIVRAVDSVSFSLEPGRCLGIVGESGSGKSQTMLGLLGLLPSNGMVSGSALFNGEQMVGMPRSRLDQLRGSALALIFQDSITGLTPHMRIGDQLAEVLQVHSGLSRRAAWAEAAQLLEIVQISEPERRLKQYPHELSGGMRQRVMIAMALLCKPALLIADEPTTALDVTVQASILRAFAKLKQHTDTAIILITHDLGVVAGLCDEVAVMYAGRLVERAPAQALFSDPKHPYTRGLLACMPRPDTDPLDELPVIAGQPPDLGALPAGCAFSPRCPQAGPVCADTPPALRQSPARAVACHAAEPA
ncbi:ABC transporter ATP-binding protein [Polymorphobacter sp.]|uniref:ABC transporter ATP-binding protein n=2 Tax=Alphaproteobacteria TaxID=28211 RepID=UPI003F70A279